MSETPILDWAKLDQLSEWGGAELKEKMIDLFFENAPVRLNSIREGLDVGDSELAERAAHSLKSSSGNLGAQTLQALAGRVESMIETGDANGAEALLPQLEESLSQTIRMLRTRQKDGAG